MLFHPRKVSFKIPSVLFKVQWAYCVLKLFHLSYLSTHVNFNGFCYSLFLLHEFFPVCLSILVPLHQTKPPSMNIHQVKYKKYGYDCQNFNWSVFINSSFKTIMFHQFDMRTTTYTLLFRNAKDYN